MLEYTTTNPILYVPHTLTPTLLVKHKLLDAIHDHWLADHEYATNMNKYVVYNASSC